MNKQTEKSKAYSLYDVLDSKWEFYAVSWDIAKDIVRGKISHIGTPIVIVWVYVLSFMMYAASLVYNSVMALIFLGIFHDATHYTYLELYRVLGGLLAMPIVGFGLYRTGRAVWSRSTKRATLAMLLSTLACLIPFGPVLFVDKMPSYCSQYLERATETSTPAQQLGANDCVDTTLRTLSPAAESSCATYIDRTAPDTYAARVPVCQAGHIPPPRSASFPQ